MKESVTYQALIAEGMAEGLALGEERGLRATIMRLGTKRFGSPTPATERTLQNIHALARLEALSERLLEVERWDELLAE